MRKIALITALLTSFATTAVSASSYVTIEGTSVSIEDSLDSDLNPLGLRLRMGMPVGDNLDIEGHFGFTRDTGDIDDDDNEFGTKYGGVFLKGYVPIGFNSAFYALVGSSIVSITETVNGIDVQDERVGFAYGAGFETKISERADLTADFVSYVRDEGLFESVSAVSFGLKFYF